MDLGAPISDVELVVVEEAPPVASSTNSTADSSSSDSDSGESKEKIISGGQVTAPGYEPVILNMGAYFKPQLLRSKNEEYDTKALSLAQTLANVTRACQGHPCALKKSGTATELDPFLHNFDGGWSFWSVENVAAGGSETQGIYMKKSVKVND